MGTIKKEVFLGRRDAYNSKLEYLAKMAQEEPWTFKSIAQEDPYRILRNYFQFTYDRLYEEKKIMFSDDQDFSCINTGLLTKYDRDIIAIFSRSQDDKLLPWRLVGFYHDGEKYFKERFSATPEMADYFTDVSEIIYDKKIQIDLNIEHIIDDNIGRFQQAGYGDKQLIHALMRAAIEQIKKKLSRNFKLAAPFYYHNTETGERKIQLLIPLYFPGAPVRLALVLDKVKYPQREPYYMAITVLPIEWAYMNARLIVKPDPEWTKIIEEIGAGGGEIEFA
ncbi:DUF3825 domain-containing protein [uncultured Selenomonas sp.]|uniref:DUF3825 domain-containing protein n=1 Tax=uncultured Selenomonas sp. TaxID=159275 RepID=UPI0028E59764|nr:DUF3825 domain-containing protein [uncultured Selenomonas sp.]